MNEYPCVARNVNAFVRQVVRYVNSGHYFFVRCLMKDRKNQIRPEEVDELMIKKYGIARKRWQRKRRHLKEKAGIHYIRFGRLYVLMLSKGKHEAFYRDHGNSKLDIRRKSMEVFSYSIKHSYSVREKREKVFVRLNDQERVRLTQHMLTIGVWDSFRDPEKLEREFKRLPYDGYDPVHEQLVALAVKVNRARRKRGFAPIELGCINRFVQIQRIYVDDCSQSKNDQTASDQRSDRPRSQFAGCDGSTVSPRANAHAARIAATSSSSLSAKNSSLFMSFPDP